MAGEIYIADKETLDSIKDDTTSIKNKLNSSSEEFKNVTYYPITNKTGTITDIVGKGKILILSRSSGSTNNQIYPRLIMDGITVMDGSLYDVGNSGYQAVLINKTPSNIMGCSLNSLIEAFAMDENFYTNFKSSVSFSIEKASGNGYFGAIVILD